MKERENEYIEFIEFAEIDGKKTVVSYNKVKAMHRRSSIPVLNAITFRPYVEDAAEGGNAWTTF
ncbi:MAG: hypothetical protein PHE79_11775 [Eubacteriales bacterium]|nr:hypothetical protein [Eubacteriales bacterium]